MFRKTYAKINEEVLTANVSQITSKYPEYQYYFAVVKGNAYGHGMHIVNALIKGGANYLAVSSLEEAQAVRRYNTDIPILCMEPISVEFLEEIIENNVTLTVDSLDYFKELNEASPKSQIKVHIKLDTGMNRLGIKKKDEVDALWTMDRHENIFIEGIYTHLATSGVSDKYYDIQIKNFKKLTKNIDLSLIPIVHIGRSLILVRHKKPDFVNGVRMGIVMYGFAQSIAEPMGFAGFKRKVLCKLKRISPTIFQNDLELKTAMSVYSSVIAVKQIKKGEVVGYGAKFKASQDMTVATVAIGYYDGIKSSFGNVFCKGEKCPILGKICMDMTSVKVSDNIKCGDKVEIFGDNITIPTLTRRSGISAYHLLTGISARVPRIMDGKEYEL